MLDQTRLPADEEVLALTGAEDTAQAIERMSVRGAPLVGVALAGSAAQEQHDVRARREDYAR